MVDRETIEFLESGCSLVLGTVAADGEPFVSRGWGLRVEAPAEDLLHVVLDASDELALENIASTGRVAITAADVRTLEAVQLKGHAGNVRAADDRDRATVVEFCEDFFGAIVAVDGTDRWLLDRLVPLDFVTCDFVVDETYNQTPGPGAGCAVPRTTADT